jgi:hypothetical protein
MDSSHVNKVYKARQYAEEPERIHIERLEAEMEGDDRPHRIVFAEGEWSCDCEYFAGHRTCAHTMAMERVFGVMVKSAV